MYITITDHSQLAIIAEKAIMAKVDIIMPVERPENVNIYGYIMKLWP